LATVRLVDPLGRSIVFHNHTWFGHILPGHPEMRTYRSLVEKSVTNPIEIRISPADPANCRLYYGVGPRPGMMIVVVGNITNGFVKTAHIVKAMKGALEWSRPIL
jgi:hypothetical protein